MWTATHSIITNKTAEQIWARYASPETWSTWDHETESAILNGPFAASSTITFKPKGGPTLTIKILECTPHKRVLDVTKLFLADFIFDHVIEQTPQGLHITHTLTIKGPFTFLWKRVFGHKVAAGLPVSMQNLIDAA
jgi:hypothetical protein